MIFTVFNLIWNSVFLEIWKRTSNELSYSWGMFDLELSDKPRAQFRGVPSINPITSKPELVYPKYNEFSKKLILYKF